MYNINTMVTYVLLLIDDYCHYYVLKQFCLRLSSVDHYLHFTMEEVSQLGKFTY